MKQKLFSILLLILACCAVQAQDFVERLMFTPGGSTLVTFPAGTLLTLNNYQRVGVELGSEGIAASDIKTIGVVLKENLESTKISLVYIKSVNDADGTRQLSPNVTPGSKEYTFNVLAADKTEGTKIYKFGIYYQNNTFKENNTIPAATLAIEKMYYIDNSDKKYEFTNFKTFNAQGIIVHQLEGEVTFTKRYAEFDITDQELSPLSYKTTDGETNIYKFIFAEDLYDNISFRLRTEDGKDKPSFTINPSTYSGTLTDTNLKLQYDEVNHEYYVEKEVTTDHLTQGNATRVYVSCSGTKNLISTDKNDYTAPWSLTLKSITRTGREGVTIKNVVDDEGWTTYCNTKRLEYSRKEDMEAYIVTARNATTGVLTLKKIDIAPGNTDETTTPVILKIPKMNGISSVTFGVPSTTLAADNCAGNMLLASPEGGVTVPTESDGFTYYALAYKSGEGRGIGFYKVKPGVRIPAKKAYLRIENPPSPSAEPAPEFLAFDASGNGTTDLFEPRVMREEVSDDIYDLSGRRVTNPVRGHLYIQNGKKFIAK